MSAIDCTPWCHIVHVYDMVFEPDLPMCGNCNRAIPEGEVFRTIAPAKTRFHVGCVSKKAVGSNSLQSVYDTGNVIIDTGGTGSVIIDTGGTGKGYKWP